MFKISPRRIPVSSARMMSRLSSPEEESSCSCSPDSNLLSLPLAILGNETIDTGFCEIPIPHSLIAMFKTLLRMVSSRFSDAGDTAFNLVSRYLQTTEGNRVDTLLSPKYFLRVCRRYFSTLWLLCVGETSSSYLPRISQRSCYQR